MKWLPDSLDGLPAFRRVGYEYYGTCQDSNGGKRLYRLRRHVNGRYTKQYEVFLHNDGWRLISVATSKAEAIRFCLSHAREQATTAN